LPNFFWTSLAKGVILILLLMVSLRAVTSGLHRGCRQS
jgi:hypothetical protein